MAGIEDLCQCQTANCGYVYDPALGDAMNNIPAALKKLGMAD